MKRVELKILIVDNRAQFIRATTTLLRAWGYNVTTSPDIDTAKIITDTEFYPLIIVGKLDDFKALVTYIRDTNKKSIIYAFSEITDNDDVDEYLPVTLSPETLKEVVDKAFDTFCFGLLLDFRGNV